jgi:hypothetical protein
VTGEAPLWECPSCGQRFVTRDMPHSCEVVALGAHFDRCEPHVRELFEAFLAAARESGPVTVNATKTRITFQVRMRFGGVDRPRRDALVARLILTRAVRDPRSERVDFIAPYYYDHRFVLRTVDDIDDGLRALLREAYRVGEQEHIRDPDWPRERTPPEWVRVPAPRDGPTR